MLNREGAQIGAIVVRIEEGIVERGSRDIEDRPGVAGELEFDLAFDAQ